jgi:hypothetical protein
VSWALFIGLDLAFAGWVTLHVALVVALALRKPRWRASAALLVPPLAPYWAFVSGMRWRAAGWLAALLFYLVFVVAASV